MQPTLPVALILGPAVIAAIAALSGAFVTNFSAERRHRRELEEKRRDKAEAKRTEEERRDIDRSLAALEYAEHLETYALQCANVVSNNAGFNHDHQKYMEVKPLPDWPTRIDWSLLGLKRAAWARNLHAQTRLLRLGLDEAWEHNGPDEQADEEGEEAAKLGLIAWDEAVEARKAHGLPPITHLPKSWDYAETLARAVERTKERAAKREASAEF